MVVAILFNRFAPSSRGLKRTERGSLRVSERDYHAFFEEERAVSGRAMEHRRKPFRAVACLTSLAADINVVSDWFFFLETRRHDNEYRATNAAREDLCLIPPILLYLILASCIVGTLLWIILATDGRLITPLLRRMGVDKLSMGMIYFLCVIFEDIPQVALTFIVEDYYESDSLSNFAVWNVMASFYDTLIKLAEAFDERNDLVETGVWCRHSLTAHANVITCVVALPGAERMEDCIKDNSKQQQQQMHRFASMPAIPAVSTLSAAELMAMAPAPLPDCLYFLTASLDTTIRLWEFRPERTICKKVFRGHATGVTSLVVLDKAKPPGSDWTGPFFLSGCVSGAIRLWSVQSQACIRSYVIPGCALSSLAVTMGTQTSFFVAGYHDGSARLWEIWSQSCVAVYNGHLDGITAICALNETLFVTGSADNSLRLWDSSEAVHCFQSRESACEDVETGSSCDYDAALPQTPVPSDEHVMCHWDKKLAREVVLEERVSKKLYTGHADTVSCVSRLNADILFVSGSLDGSARIWSVESGTCLRILTDHEKGITSISAIDEVTFLTGSKDNTVKAWDVPRGACLRTYTGHRAHVTSISVTEDETTFVTSSADQTIKLWVLTAVPSEASNLSLDHALACNDGLCRGLDPA